MRIPVDLSVTRCAIQLPTFIPIVSPVRTQRPPLHPFSPNIDASRHIAHARERESISRRCPLSSKASISRPISRYLVLNLRRRHRVISLGLPLYPPAHPPAHRSFTLSARLPSIYHRHS